jgi:hypothetical protein
VDDGQGEAVQLKNYLKQVSKASIWYGTFKKDGQIFYLQCKVSL